jgi:hypothetical protein
MTAPETGAAAAEPRYRLWHPLGLAYFSRALYQDVGRRWRGLGLSYLLLLLLLSWGLWSLKLHTDLNAWVEAEAPAVVEQIPPIHIREGTVSVEAEEPYIIREPETDRPLAVLDSSGTYTTIPQANEALGLSGAGTDSVLLLLTADSIHARKNTGAIEQHDLSQVQSFDLSAEDVRGWLRLAAAWAAPLLFLLCLPVSFLFRLAQALLYGALGLLFAQLAGARLAYAQSLRLAVVALTPLLALDTLFFLIEWQPPAWWLLGIGVGLGYLYFAVSSCRDDDAAAPAEAPPPVDGTAGA